MAAFSKGSGRFSEPRTVLFGSVARRIFVVVLSVSISGAVGRAASFQRMALFAGDGLELAPRGSGELSARCVDEHADPPTRGSDFTTLYNAPPNAVTVYARGQAIPLQRALDDGMVSITGTSPANCFQCLIDAVRVNNLTDGPIEIRVSRAAVLGGAGHGALKYDPNTLLGGTQSQDEIWARQARIEEVMQDQESLAALRYYDGPIDGSVGPKFTAAVRSFQREAGLVADGKYGPKTAEGVRKAMARTARLEQANEGAADHLLVTLEARFSGTAPGEYVLYDGQGKLVYRGRDMTALMKTLDEQSSGDRTVYIDLENFPEQRAEALATSVRNHSQAAYAKSRLRPLNRDSALAVNEATRTQDLFFKKEVRLQDSKIEISPEPVSDGPRAGLYQVEAKFRIGIREAALRAYARSKSILQDFVERLSSCFRADRLTNESLASIVNRIRRDLKTQYELRDDDLILEFITEFGGFFLVEIENSTSAKLFV